MDLVLFVAAMKMLNTLIPNEVHYDRFVPFYPAGLFFAKKRATCHTSAFMLSGIPCL